VEFEENLIFYQMTVFYCIKNLLSEIKGWGKVSSDRYFYSLKGTFHHLISHSMNFVIQ